MRFALAGSLLIQLPWTVANAAETPEFTGVWARTTFGYDPPASGPGPLVNLTRRANGTSDAFRPTGDYKNPILRPWAADVVKQHGAISLSGNVYHDLSSNCRLLPPPYILRSPEIQILQGKDRITFLYVQDHQFRQIRLNTTHPAYVRPSWYGDSIGHYEGDTLVVDTVEIKTAPDSMIDAYGTPYTPALHVIERYRLIDGSTAAEAQARSEHEYGRPTVEPVYVDNDYHGKGLQVQFTVEDRGAFTEPWGGSATYRRSTHTELAELVCAESTGEYYPGAASAIPRADKPDF